MSEIGVAIVGCGLIGHKRAANLVGARLLWCVDVDEKKAHALSALHKGAQNASDWKQALTDPKVHIVIVATPNNTLGPVTIAALEAGKDVLVEKPAGRSLRDTQEIIDTACRTGRLVRVGFNHRYHPAFQQARTLVDQGALGPLMFARARYGHGGRLGYEREWRANPQISGGGELIDQGVHLIDLSRWFLGDFAEMQGHAQTCFWDMPVDDNAFMILRTEQKQTAFLHVSCSEWKNLFSFELYGRDGKLAIDGLGGSYGVEKLTFYRMLPEMGPPETTSWEYPQRDRSWEIEFCEFLEDVRTRRQPSASIHDAHAAMRIVSTLYERSGYDHHS
jgi:predicted dehydrogenase